MDYGKLNSAYQAVQQLVDDPHTSFDLSVALHAVAKDLREGADFAHNQKLVAQEMVICLSIGERIGRINGKCVLEGYSEDFGWQERMNCEIPLEPERIKHWLGGWEETAAAAALLLLTTLPANREVPVELPKAA